MQSNLSGGLTEPPQSRGEQYSKRLMRGSGYSASGFPGAYDSHRPSPPEALFDVLCLEAQVDRPALVVDLGAGTGLSTRAWADRAEEVVGIEASPEMRNEAEAATPAGNVRYVQAFAHQTGLSASAADIVTCSQSFHWMDPEPTLAEAARLLRPGGVFAAYDYDWPPIVQPDVEAAYEEVWRRLAQLRSGPGAQIRYSKEGHLERIRESGHFRYAREALLHSRERGSTERIIGMVMSVGQLTVLLKEGVSEEELGLAALRETCALTLGEGEVEMFLGYRVRLAVR